jgi:hypothetical protein
LVSLIVNNILLFNHAQVNNFNTLDEENFEIKEKKQIEMKNSDLNKYRNYLQLNPGATTAAIDDLWLASEDFADNLNSLKHILQHTINSVTWQGIMHSFMIVVVYCVFSSINITIIRLGHNIIGQIFD